MNQPYNTYQHGQLDRFYPNFYPNRQQRRAQMYRPVLTINNRKAGNSRETKLQIVPLFDEDQKIIGFKNIYHKNYTRMIS